MESKIVDSVAIVAESIVKEAKSINDLMSMEFSDSKDKATQMKQAVTLISKQLNSIDIRLKKLEKRIGL